MTTNMEATDHQLEEQSNLNVQTGIIELLNWIFIEKLKKKLFFFFNF